VRRAQVIILLVAGACAALIATGLGCRSKAEPPPGWVRLEGDSVSLALPDSFLGGRPDDPQVIAVLEEIAARNPDSARAAALGAALELMKRDPGPDSLLIAWTEPNSDGTFASVTVERSVPYGVESLEAWIEADLGRLLDAEWSIESLGENEGYAVVSFLPWDGAAEAMVQHVVYMVVGPRLFTARYTLDHQDDEALADVFWASAATIVVED
jgi:hypothetical protein